MKITCQCSNSIKHTGGLCSGCCFGANVSDLNGSQVLIAGGYRICQRGFPLTRQAVCAGQPAGAGAQAQSRAESPHRAGPAYRGSAACRAGMQRASGVHRVWGLVHISRELRKVPWRRQFTGFARPPLSARQPSPVHGGIFAMPSVGSCPGSGATAVRHCLGWQAVRRASPRNVLACYVGCQKQGFSIQFL